MNSGKILKKVFEIWKKFTLITVTGTIFKKPTECGTHVGWHHLKRAIYFFHFETSKSQYRRIRNHDQKNFDIFLIFYPLGRTTTEERSRVERQVHVLLYK